jgi:hypothetical protein
MNGSEIAMEDMLLTKKCQSKERPVGPRNVWQDVLRPGTDLRVAIVSKQHQIRFQSLLPSSRFPKGSYLHCVKIWSNMYRKYHEMYTCNAPFWLEVLQIVDCGSDILS